MTELRIREAARAILITPSAEVLLVRFEFPTRTVWAVPGGGIDPGEDDQTALHRELWEEVGLRDMAFGPLVWNREHIVPHTDGRWDGQRDRFYHVPVAQRFDPRPSLTWEQLRAERVHEIRWWTVDEVEAATDTWFAPQRMGQLLRSLVETGPPDEPVETGV